MTVTSRIRFGSVITAQTEAGHHHAVIGLGRRPKGMKGTLSSVGTEGESDDYPLYRSLQDAASALRRCSLGDDESPFRDKDGLVEKLAGAIFSSEGDPSEMALRMIENRPYIDPETESAFPRNSPEACFRLETGFLTPDSLPYAGGILSQEKRGMIDESTGAYFFNLAHPMEPYLLSVSALRSRGVPAFVANSVMPGEAGQESLKPLIAIVDLMREVPLLTFDLFPLHPPMASIDLMSDKAVRAVTFAMQAEARVKHLATDMVLESEGGKELPMERIVLSLERAADSLLECYRIWPGCNFISNALTSSTAQLAEALMAIRLGEMQARIHEIISEHPEFAVPGTLENTVYESSLQTALDFTKHMDHALSLRISRL